MLDSGEKLCIIIFCVFRLFAFFTIPTNMYILIQKHVIPDTIRKIYLISFVCVIPATIVTFFTSSSYVFNDSYAIDQNFLYIQKLLQGTSGWVIRYSILFVLFERLIATAYWETYEKNPKIQKIIVFLGIGLLILSVLTAIWLLHFRPNDSFSFIVMGAVQLISFMLAWFLIWKNHRLRETTKCLPFLSQRYQIVENIQILQFLKPFVFLETFMTSLGPFTGLVMPYFTPSVIIRNHIFYLNYDLYYGISAYLFYLEFKRRKQSHPKVEPKRRIAWIDSSTPAPKKQEDSVTVKTVLGKSIPKKQSLDAHFMELNKIWKV